jgi:hypothetical protein
LEADFWEASLLARWLIEVLFLYPFFFFFFFFFFVNYLRVSFDKQAKSVEGLQITQIFPEDGNMGLIFPKYLSEWTTGKLRQGFHFFLLFLLLFFLPFLMLRSAFIKSMKIFIEGINIVQKSLVTDILQRENGVTLVLKGGKTLDVDHVVVAIGIDANMDLARKAGLEIDERRGGIVVNSELESRRNVFAAGDASSYHDIALGRRRVEHYEHAIVSGKVAGENMTGARKPYKHQPMFWLAYFLHEKSFKDFIFFLKYIFFLSGATLGQRLDMRRWELLTLLWSLWAFGQRRLPRIPRKLQRHLATSDLLRLVISRIPLRPKTKLQCQLSQFLKVRPVCLPFFLFLIALGLSHLLLLLLLLLFQYDSSPR